jgi:ceramide glucosyltransferase
MTILSITLFVLVILGSFYTLFSLICVLSFFRGHVSNESYPPESTELPAVSVLKAIKGLDPRCAENLSSFCHQDYPCYEVLFGFRDPDDPAIPVAGSITGSASCEIGVVVKNNGSGTNQKVLNLQALADNARYPLLALSDSDMEVDGCYLRRIVGEFQGARKTGIVTSLYKISNPSSIGSALESLTIALDFIPSVLVARRMEGVTFGLGASILVSKEAIKEIGGFESMANYLADDYQMGYRLWRAGYNNVISRYVIENRVGQMSVADHLSHQLRWARTYRASRPWGFFGYGITHAFAFAVLSFCIRPGPISALTVALVLALRYALALVLYRKVICARKWLRSLVLLPLKDLLSFFVWLWSFAGAKVVWRGIRYRIIAGGRMIKT